jgi:hypothetical protein
MPLSTIFQLYRGVNFIGGGNRNSILIAENGIQEHPNKNGFQNKRKKGNYVR